MGPLESFLTFVAVTSGFTTMVSGFAAAWSVIQKEAAKDIGASVALGAARGVAIGLLATILLLAIVGIHF